MASARRASFAAQTEAAASTAAAPRRAQTLRRMSAPYASPLNAGEMFQLARRVAEILCRHASLVQEADQQVVQRSVLRIFEVPPALQLASAGAQHGGRQFVMRVNVG